MITHTLPPSPLPARQLTGHKGTFGTVAVVGGCAVGNIRMIGAPVLSARAALRGGCGLVKLFVPQSLVELALGLLPSATARALPQDADGDVPPTAGAEAIDAAVGTAECVVIGPGLGTSPGAAHLAMRAVHQVDTHVVLDADGINALTTIPEFAVEIHAALVITPHPGEFARLADALNMHVDAAALAEPAMRVQHAAAVAQRLGCIVVLKGAGTVVTDGLRTYVNDTGNDALATAGTGDVLAGLIGSLIAQHVGPPPHPRPWPMPAKPRPIDKPLDAFAAACLAVRAHGLAAEVWQKSHSALAGLLAEELADCLPTALDSLRTK